MNDLRSKTLKMTSLKGQYITVNPKEASIEKIDERKTKVENTENLKKN